MYRTLQSVLSQSQWQSVSGAFSSSEDLQGSKDRSSIDKWISKPFPGFWACKIGFILWRSPFHSTTARTDVRTFCLTSIDDIVLSNLTKTYWHALCRPSVLTPQCQASKFPKTQPCLDECRNCHDATLRLSDLERKHKALLRLLVGQSGGAAKLDSNLDLVFQNLETLESTRVPCRKSRVQRFIPGGSYVQEEIEHQRSEDIVQNTTDELNQGSKRVLDGPKHISPSRKIGVASDEIKPFFPWVSVIRMMKVMILECLRVAGLCEPLLETGKSRVRWRCVSSP